MTNNSNAQFFGKKSRKFLFNVYIYVNLKECSTGCIAGGTLVNHLMYADDIVLQSPSATGLSLLFASVWKLWIGA